MYTSTTLAVFGLAALGSSHMIMNTPVPYGKSSLTNSPLLADGSDFPCKQRTGVYEAEGASNSMALGSSQPLAFTGSATHGGGSCQISITYDEAPTANSVFKVIHSIEGGCPIEGVAGNNGDNANAVDPSTYSFTIPSTLPTGSATLAWTWFNKIGNREMYMNCAPVTITGSSSKRDEDELLGRNITQIMERDTAAFNALPDMFTANIGGTCKTIDSKDVIFPSPGDSLELRGTATSSDLAAPTGCAAGTGGSSPSTATAGGSGSGATSAAASPKATSSAAGVPGGVFATVPASSASKATVTPVASAAPIATQASSAAPVASPVASSASPAASSGTSTGTSGTGSAMVAGSACTTEGMWNCIGGTSFQQCASGTWSVVQELAAGTSCTTGQSAAINITASGKAKRAIRFSGEHIRRHIHKS